MKYLDFEVEIGQQLDGAYPVHVLRSPGGEARASAHVTYGPRELAARLAAVQAALLRPDLTRSAPAQPPGPEADLHEQVPEVQQLGQELFTLLFGPSLSSLLRSSQATAEERKRGLRIKLRIDAPELAMLPWEFLYDPERHDYLSLAASRPLVRYVPFAGTSEPLAMGRPLRILGVIASPAGLRPLNVERERQRLELAIDALRGRGDVELVWLGGQSARYLQAALRDGPWHILHFIGHGGFDREAGKGFVVLANDDGGPKLLYAQDLAHLVNDHRDMRLVVLNACDGARGNEVDLFSSSASFLVQQGTPAVVAMQFEITDEAAIEFSRSFYEALADGSPIDTALAEARKSMSIAHQGSLEWGTPVLYTHAADGVLFNIKRAAGRVRARLTSAGTSGPTAVVFDARDSEAVNAVARELERSRKVATSLLSIGAGSAAPAAVIEALERTPGCVVVCGPGGLTILDDPIVSRTLERRSHDPAFRIAPVLVPGSALPDLAQMPGFLAGRAWVDLRSGIAAPDRIDALAAAIGTEVAIAPARSSAQADEPPFRGLQVFEEEHADNFFGREALTQQLVERLRAGRFLAVVGPSGSGKSSVVRAGLIPNLRQNAISGSGAWPIALLKPGSHPLQALAATLPPLMGSAGDAVAARDSILTALLHGTRGLHTTIDTALAGQPASRRFVLVIDQFEELFTLCRDEAERERFISLLLEAIAEKAGQTIVALTMRADFMGRTSTFPALAATIAEHVVLVTPMTREELRRAMVMPALRAGLQFEGGVVDTILAELGGEAGALPLLEDTLLELWQGRAGGWLTMEHYRTIGGVRGALEQRADGLYGALPENRQQIARQILLGLVELGTGAEVTRRRARLSEFAWSRPGMEPPEVDAVLQKLVDARLVTIGSDESGETVDVAHEALINSWQTLRGWIEVYGAGVRLHRALVEEARRWESGGRDASDLRRGRRLAEATTWSRETLDDSADVAPYLDASIAAEQAAEKARLEADADKQRSRRRQQRTVLGLGAAIMVVLAIGAGVAIWLAARAEDARSEAEHAQLVAEAQAKLAGGVTTAATKPLPGFADTLEGWALAGQAGVATSDYRSTVEDLLRSGRIAALGKDVERVTPSPGGQFVAVDVSGGPGSIVRLTDGSRVAGLAGQVSTITVGPPSAGVFGVQYLDAPAELRQWATGTAIPLGNDVPDFHFADDGIGTVVIIGFQLPASPDNDTVVVGGGSPPEVRSMVDGALIRRLDAQEITIAVLPSTDGDRAVVSYADHTEIVRLTDGQTVRTIGTSGYRAATGGPATIFAAGGGAGSSPGFGGACAIRRTADGAVLSALPRWATHGAFIDTCGVVSVSPDGARAAISLRHRVVLIDVAKPEAKPIWSTTDDIVAVAIPPGEDRSRLLTFGLGIVKLWRIGDATPLATLTGRLSNIDYASPTTSFSPDGAFAVFKLDGAMTLLRMSDGAVIDIPFATLDTESPLPVATRIDFATVGATVLAHVVLTDGEESTIIPEKPLQRLVEGRFAAWPDGSGPGVVEYADPAFGVPFAEMPFFSDVLFGTSGHPSLGVVRFAPDATALSSEPEQPALVLFGDGSTVALRMDVAAVEFSRTGDTSTLVVRYLDERSEIWDSGLRRAIGVLGLGVGETVFDESAQRLVVRYLSGDAYLVDLARLRELPIDIGALSDVDLMTRACATLGGSATSWAPSACK